MIQMIYVYIFNVVISKYSVLLTIPKSCVDYYPHMPNKWGDEKFDHPHSHRLFFMDKGEHLILVLLCEGNLEHKEICASDWLKPIYVLVTHIHFDFLCITFQI